MPNAIDQFPDLSASLKNLCESAWKDADIDSVKVDRWLRNFTGGTLAAYTEQHHAFHLLNQLIYFGQKEIDECLRVLFREQVAYPFVQSLKAAGISKQKIGRSLASHLVDCVRFVGVGGPSESGVSFLYPFRKVNGLPKACFSTINEITLMLQSGTPSLITNIIYIDDFCATGEQVERYEKDAIAALRKLYPGIRISYYIPFATQRAITHLRGLGMFDSVEAAIVIDNDYKAFSTNSHFYRSTPTGIDKASAQKIMYDYGLKLTLVQDDALGFNDSQMLISFRHNTPDNTLPVIWDANSSIPWHPIFPRAQKF